VVQGVDRGRYGDRVQRATTRGTAVVTGASSGIGAATARALAADGWDVVVGARRIDRLEEVAAAVGGRAHALDVTDGASVDAFVAAVPECRLLVNNAGGALGLTSVAEADESQWQMMYDTNVLGVVRVTKGLLGALEASGDGQVVTIGSIAAHEPYPGGAGYNAAKFAVRAVMSVLRQELLGRPVRVCEIDPGMVETEFSLVRFEGDADRAAKVYEGVTPLTADDIAECVRWVASRPGHVNIDQMIVLARDQAGARQVHRR
jgi:NADP-dependent 3-hydroxy acid dehydrogenase YdfG